MWGTVKSGVSPHFHSNMSFNSLIIFLTKGAPPPSRRVGSSSQVHSFGRDAHAVLREGKASPGRSMNRPWPGGQWGHRCYSQVVLIPSMPLFRRDLPQPSLPFLCDRVFQMYKVNGKIEKFRTHDNTTRYLLSTVIDPGPGRRQVA